MPDGGAAGRSFEAGIADHAPVAGLDDSAVDAQIMAHGGQVQIQTFDTKRRCSSFDYASSVST